MLKKTVFGQKRNSKDGIGGKKRNEEAARIVKKKTVADGHPHRPLSSAAREHHAFWSSLEDHDFFGPSVQHIYFYANVDDETVLNFRKQVLDACAEKRDLNYGSVRGPRPIVIHVMSPGGLMHSDNWFISLFSFATAPLCAMVDGSVASAATMITVIAPFRVATAYSLTLIHDYSSAYIGKREVLMDNMMAIEKQRALYKRLYLSHTRIPEHEIEAILRRDMWLDAATCLRYGMYDRVIAPDRNKKVREFLSSHKMLGMRGETPPYLRHDWNHVFSVCDGTKPVQRMDEILATQDTEMRPIVYFAPGSALCDDGMQAIAMIARILASPVPVFCVIDNTLSIWQMLPLLFCARRFMFETATVALQLTYTSALGKRLNDIVHNNGVMRSLILRALRERAKPTDAFIKNLFDKDHFLTAEDCLNEGMIDEVIHIE